MFTVAHQNGRWTDFWRSENTAVLLKSCHLRGSRAIIFNINFVFGI